MFDVLIRNGLVVDGTGIPGYTADVGIEGDTITLVGRLQNASAAVEVDATGKVVCPGIIDPHSHADLSLFREDHTKLLEPLVRQGITTFVGGNCGMSLAPIGSKHRDTVKEYIQTFTHFDFERDVQWKSMGEFLDTLETRGVLLNAAILAPHGIMRLNELGPDMVDATDENIAAMAYELDRAMEEGAIGLSTGLQYIPGCLSDTRELLALGKVLKKYDGMFASHLRSYSNSLDKAIDEVIEVAETNGIPAQISHIFWVPDWGRLGPYMRRVVRQLAKMSDYWTPPVPLEHPLAQRILQMMRARERGVRVGMDVMPTTTAFTHALAFFPPWAMEGGVPAIVGRLGDRDTRAKILNAIENGNMEWPHREGDSWSLNLFQLMGWEAARIMAVVSEKNKRYEGMSLVDIAAERQVHPFDALCDLLLEEEGHVLVFMSIARPEDNLTERTTFAPIRHPQVCVSTDTLLMGFGRPSHLFYGCYPKFIGRYVRDKKVLSLETAINKVTGLPAEHFNLKKRGRVAIGHFADVVVFDLGTIASRATFAAPEEFPVGIDHVFINGRHVVNAGTFTPEPRPGRILRRAS